MNKLIICVVLVTLVLVPAASSRSPASSRLPQEDHEGCPGMELIEEHDGQHQPETDHDFDGHGPHFRHEGRMDRGCRRHRGGPAFKEPFHKMEVKQREMELDFQRQMRELELEERRIDLERKRTTLKKKYKKMSFGRMMKHHFKRCRKTMFVLFGLCLIVHILLSVWVYSDIRKRNTGSGLWIVITLLTGPVGALLYLLARLGDKSED